jgi:hypothetical protein
MENRMKRPNSATPWALENSMATPTALVRTTRATSSIFAFSWVRRYRWQNYGPSRVRMFDMFDIPMINLPENIPYPTLSNHKWGWGSFYLVFSGKPAPPSPISSNFIQFHKAHCGMVYYWT